MRSPVLQIFFYGICVVQFLGFRVAAQTYAFEGALLLNGQRSNPISYRLDFTLQDGIIRGHSVTDLFGAHETKNEIKGTFSPSEGVLSFQEEGILYTKSPLQRDIFCFVRFSGKVESDSGGALLKGEFTGRYPDRQPCARGRLLMMGSADVQKLLARIDEKMGGPGYAEKGVQSNRNVVRLYDSLQLRRLNAGENLSVFWDANAIDICLRDKYLEDGDVVTLYHNGKPILQEHRVTAAPFVLNIPLVGATNVFTLEAVGEGSRPPNTALVSLEGGQRVEFQSNLKKGQRATIQIVQPKP